MAVMPGSRQALLDAADRLRHREPGRALGAREIAREAGVNHSLLFRHFGSVSGLLLELETSSFGELERSMAEATSTEEVMAALAGMVVLVGADVTPPSGALETALLALLQVGDAGDGAAHPPTPFV